jgi:hypothetical protein
VTNWHYFQEALITSTFHDHVCNLVVGSLEVWCRVSGWGSPSRQDERSQDESSEAERAAAVRLGSAPLGPCTLTWWLSGGFLIYLLKYMSNIFLLHSMVLARVWQHAKYSFVVWQSLALILRTFKSHQNREV